MPGSFFNWIRSNSPLEKEKARLSPGLLDYPSMEMYLLDSMALGCFLGTDSFRMPSSNLARISSWETASPTKKVREHWPVYRSWRM